LATPELSVIWKAYVPEARSDGGVHVKVDPESFESMTVTVCRAEFGPFFNVMVTGPEASAQVRVNGWPDVMP
jgi:hypothetical protein